MRKNLLAFILQFYIKEVSITCPKILYDHILLRFSNPKIDEIRKAKQGLEILCEKHSSIIQQLQVFFKMLDYIFGFESLK